MIFCELSYKEKRNEVIKYILGFIFLLGAIAFLTTMGIISYSQNIIPWVLIPVVCSTILYSIYNFIMFAIQLKYIVTDKVIWIFYHDRGDPVMCFVPKLDDYTYNKYLKYLKERGKHVRV